MSSETSRACVRVFPRVSMELNARTMTEGFMPQYPSAEIRTSDAMHTGFAKRAISGCNRVVTIDCPAGILNHIGRKARCPAVDCGVTHTVVVSQAGKKNALQFALAQVSGEPGACA